MTPAKRAAEEKAFQEFMLAHSARHDQDRSYEHLYGIWHAACRWRAQGDAEIADERSVKVDFCWVDKMIEVERAELIAANFGRFVATSIRKDAGL